MNEKAQLLLDFFDRLSATPPPKGGGVALSALDRIDFFPIAHKDKRHGIIE
jgi:hypothetical protein